MFTNHEQETFHVETDLEQLKLLLEKRRRRFEGGEPSVRYRFSVLSRELLEVRTAEGDDDPASQPHDTDIVE